MIDSVIDTYYVWNARNQLVGLADGSGVFHTRFIYGTKSYVPDYMVRNNINYQIVANHLGSPVAVVDTASGTVEQEITYDEFGNILSDTNPGFIPFGFAGCLYDVDTKLCRFGARDYDASIGRWLSKDPILFAGGDTNLYGYVMQDPINFIDPSGNTAAAVGKFGWEFLKGWLKLDWDDVLMKDVGPEGLNANEPRELQRMKQEMNMQNFMQNQGPIPVQRVSPSDLINPNRDNRQPSFCQG